MRPTPRKRAAEEIADRLRWRILSGEFPAGPSLPPERDLAEDLGVSRLTLRAAMARLETEGLVRPVHGSGNRVLDFRESGGRYHQASDWADFHPDRLPCRTCSRSWGPPSVARS